MSEWVLRVETLTLRQAAFEAEMRGKFDALDAVVKTALADALKTIATLMGSRARRPDAGKALSN